MKRAHAARVITKRRLFETLISPGYYLALVVGLFLGFFLVTGFVNSIDSSGFNYQLNPVYDLIGRSFEGAFGKTFVEQLFDYPAEQDRDKTWPNLQALLGEPVLT